jgi:hypothetical protein
MVAAVSLVDIDTLDLAAGEPLSGFDDGAQRVAVIRIAGQRPGVPASPLVNGAGMMLPALLGLSKAGRESASPPLEFAAGVTGLPLLSLM